VSFVPQASWKTAALSSLLSRALSLDQRHWLWLDLTEADCEIMRSLSYWAGCWRLTKAVQGISSEILHKTQFHLTQSFRNVISNFVSSLSFSECFSHISVLCGDKLKDRTWLFEWVRCSACSSSVSLHISLIAFLLPSELQINLYALSYCETWQHDSPLHPHVPFLSHSSYP